MTATQIDTHARGHQRSIGPLGTIARILVGGLLVAGQWLRARRTPTPLRATGPVAHALNAAVFLVLYLLEPTSDAALLRPVLAGRPAGASPNHAAGIGCSWLPAAQAEQGDDDNGSAKAPPDH